MEEIDAEKMMNRIDSIVEKMGITKKEFAVRCGTTYQSMVDWKIRGTIPSAKILYNIAQVSGVTMEFLLTGKEPLTDDIAILNASLLTLTEKERKPIIIGVRSFISAYKYGK